MDNDALLFLARLIGLVGLGLLIISSLGGTLLASRTAQKLKFLKGKTFKYHRLTSLIGAGLFLLHPIPLLFARQITGMHLLNIFVPFTAPKQGLWIAIGIFAAYALIIVSVSSLWIKKMKRSTWRVLHYGTYLVLVLGLLHGLFISAEFGGDKDREAKPAITAAATDPDQAKPDADGGEAFDFGEPEKIILLVMAGITLCYPAWRIVMARRNAARPTAA